MEGQSIAGEGSAAEPLRMRIEEGWRQPTADRARVDETVPRRLEWIAVILFIVSMFVMMFSYSMFMSDEGLGMATVAISMVTSVILLFSVLLSIFAKTAMSKITLGIGIVGLMIMVFAIGAKLMQVISEYHDRWYY